MINSERYGAGCLLTRPDVLLTRRELLEERVIGNIQLMMIPMERRVYQQAIEQFDGLSGKIRVHAPHHAQQVNPCDPGLFRSGDPKAISAYLEEAMNQTAEAADRTGSEIIVLHAGRYLPGHKEEAIHTFHEFLDHYPDKRYILENLPELKPVPVYLGTTPEELQNLGDGKVQGYCIDFPHLWCTALSHGVPYSSYLSAMNRLPLRFSHLSGSPGPDEEKQHLLFDDPANRFTPDQIRDFLVTHPDLEISLEFPHDDVGIIRAQLQLLPF